MRILAIDPGYERSAWLVLVDGRPWLLGNSAADVPMYAHGISPNDELLASLRAGGLPNGFLHRPEVVVIEQIESFGMAVGREVFQTVFWSGRFAEAAHPTRAIQLPRRAVKLHLCGSARAKDPNIRAALIDRFGPGKEKAVGKKRSPGPLYKISGDVWSALAVAVTYADTPGAWT